jgi:hypothetical protein
VPFLPMPPEPLDSVFMMSNPGHMLAKLYWEVRNLHRALECAPENLGEVHAAAYIAFNCSVTAWHLTDWVWTTATKTDREQLLSRLGLAVSGDDKKDFSRFQSELRERYRALHIARQIATGSKHTKVTVHPDPKVRTKMQWDVHRARVGELTAGSALSIFRYGLLVSDDGKERPAIDVFEETVRVWQRLLSEWGFVEPTFVEGVAH